MLFNARAEHSFYWINFNLSGKKRNAMGVQHAQYTQYEAELLLHSLFSDYIAQNSYS